jgi:ubiquitin-conjugating enzyme E2 O
VKFFFQVVEDPQYQIIKTAEMQTSADELPEEKLTVELVAKVEKPNPSSEDSISKRFDVVTDCSDHHFVKEIGHENVMHLLKLSVSFCFK